MPQAIIYQGTQTGILTGGPTTGVGPAPAPIDTTPTIYSTAGDETYTVPDGVGSVLVECWGGGSGGGGAGVVGAPGGGAGAYAKKLVFVVPGEEIPVTVGAGGAGAPIGTTTPTNGGDSSFNSSVVVAKGGSGRTGGLASASTGDTKFNGGTTAGLWSDGFGQGGASSAGTAAAGNAPVGKTGGVAVTGGGAGGTGGNTDPSSAGVAGAAPGGGGGGGGNLNGEDQDPKAGGAGAAGKVKITPVS